ncbi:hypothetical protein FOXB_02931 [Fusarium oxysporum f. sp. conglutinans Fo5176]|uniref:Uncharacterized protein n=1 Tax=Fusarium oxysporum (strain Fo5176) TaxID=660025 RepID=F9F956_FUSOF|nr:hypothetical protein FOXB_02931 [Fusarium oxysporum f. sp. conglutinans Fo5176]
MSRQLLVNDSTSVLHDMEASILCFLKAYSTAQIHDPASAYDTLLENVLKH